MKIKQNSKVPIPFHIAVSGNIGTGKSSISKILSQQLECKMFSEPVPSSLLENVYSDMERWGFTLQVFNMTQRIKQHQEILNNGLFAIQDRTVYEDFEVFITTLREYKTITNIEFSTLNDLYHVFINDISPPDLFIYLKAPISTIKQRIINRGRGFEKDIEEDWLAHVQNRYEQWISKITNVPVITVNVDIQDLINNLSEQNQLIEQIRTYRQLSLQRSSLKI